MEFDPAQFAGCLVSGMSDAIICADAEGMIRQWNRGATRILGFAEGEALGRSLDIIIPESLREGIGEDSAPLCAPGSRAMKTAKSCPSRLFGRMAHGSLSSSLSCHSLQRLRPDDRHRGFPERCDDHLQEAEQPGKAPAMRGWTLSPAASAVGWLRPLPIELIAMGTNIHTASLSFQCLRNSRPKPVIGVAPASFFGSASTMTQEIGFALDSPVEESGFEFSVLRATAGMGTPDL